MTDNVRTFADEYAEISGDLADQSQLIGTFWDDPALRPQANELINVTLETAINLYEEDPLRAMVEASGLLLTFGFYLGREHALRGYAAPIPRRDVTVADVPDTAEGL